MTEQQITEPEVEQTEDVISNDTPDTDETEGVPDQHTPDGSAPAEEPSDDEDTFPRHVVEKLRRENAGYREKAKKAENYARELFHARVAATGRLADPDDLTFDEHLLDDRDALLAAVEDLIARKPHLALRKPRGDVGAGALSSDAATVDLAGLLRSRV